MASRLFASSTRHTPFYFPIHEQLRIKASKCICNTTQLPLDSTQAELAITNGLAPRTACDFEARHDSDKSDTGRTKSPHAAAARQLATYRSTPAQHTKLIVKPDLVLRGRFPLSAHIRQLVLACDEGEAIRARAGRRLYLPAGLSSGRKAFWVGPESTNVVWAYASTHLFYRDDMI